MGRSTKATTLARQAEALQLHSDGLSHDEIAQRLGYAHRSSVWRLIDSALRERASRSAEANFALQEERLLAVLAAYWERAMSGSATAANVVLKALDQLDRLYGFDRPGREGRERQKPWGIVKYASYEDCLAAEGPSE